MNAGNSQYLVVIRRPVKIWLANRQQSAAHISKNTILGRKDPEILCTKFFQSYILVLVKRSTVATGWLDRWTAGLLHT
jgi:hypothetical protein